MDGTCALANALSLALALAFTLVQLTPPPPQYSTLQLAAGGAVAGSSLGLQEQPAV